MERRGMKPRPYYKKGINCLARCSSEAEALVNKPPGVMRDWNVKKRGFFASIFYNEPKLLGVDKYELSQSHVVLSMCVYAVL